ncbi:hypothetical protein GCM10009851_27380 [Herbiconiux moechotypicola]|uniref:Lipoprotein n=2 Tax=Herbiconiux moechotypicola TaxID=637393 RepID=A0ABP5QRT8_9MICO|nr:hypothetical protein [Herbiconiux moechotypicola]
MRAPLAAATAAALAVALSGCSLMNAITPPVETALYPTMTDATGPDATLAVPSWVPSDALNIQIKENTETGESILQFGQPTPVTTPIGQPCDASVADQRPTMQDTWWPQSIAYDQVVCDGDWHIFLTYGVQYFAWRNADPSQGGTSTPTE